MSVCAQQMFPERRIDLPMRSPGHSIIPAAVPIAYPNDEKRP